MSNQTLNPRQAMGQRLPLWPLLAMALAGVALLYLSPDQPDKDFPIGLWMTYGLTALALAIASIPSVSIRIANVLHWLRHPSRRGRWITTLAMFALAMTYYHLSSVYHQRQNYPKIQDEFMFNLQARMLAGGHLWLPAHPIGDFFDSFFVITKPVYAAAYFPGTSFFYVPGVWLGAAAWTSSIVISSLLAALFYVFLLELIDGVAGLLGVLLLLSLEQFRTLSTLQTSYIPLLVTFLLSAICFLRWRKSGKIAWAVGMGAFAGWAAITRPLDAICLLFPLIVSMIWHLRRAARGAAALVVVGAALLGAIPFLSVQLIFDKATTGHLLKTPIGEYGRVNFPGLQLGYTPTPNTIPSPSPLVKVRDFYDELLREAVRWHGTTPFYRSFTQSRLPNFANSGVPSHLLYLLLPLGLLALRRRGAVALAAGVVIIPFAYTFWPPYVGFYGALPAISFLTLALLGVDALVHRFPRAAPAIVLAIAMLAITSLPEVRMTLTGRSRSLAKEGQLNIGYLGDINTRAAAMDRPAVILFYFTPKQTNVYEEPVYNIDTAWPDDAKVIRANDLGERNIEIFEYYAKQEPQRFFYRYDRSKREMEDLGWARDLAAKYRKPIDNSKGN